MLTHTPRREFLRSLAATPLVVLALTCSLLVPLSARSAEVDGIVAWPWKPRVTVELRGPVHVLPTVDRFNEALPEEGPHLVFVETPVKDCIGAKPEKGAITVCWLPEDSAAYGMAFYNIKRGFMVGAAVGIQRGGVDDSSLYCHEMMHALTGLGDRYGTQPGKSCLYGEDVAPGVWDREFFAKLYTGDTPPRKHRKHRH